MALIPRNSLVVLLMLVVFASVAASTAANKSVAESQPKQQADQRQVQTTTGSSDDATIFLSRAEIEISQLQKDMTLSQWRNLHGKDKGWTRTPEKKLEMTDVPPEECLSYVKTETLPSGAKLSRVLYFYPPPASSPVIFPTQSRQELINGCVLAMVRVQAAAPNQDFGLMIDRAVQKRFNGIYGESIGAKDVAFWGPGARSYYSARWIRRAEIVSGYDDNNQFFSDEHALVSVPFVFVRARLPLVKNLEYPGINEHRKTFLDVAQFRHAIAVAGLNSVLSQRMEKLYEIETSLSASLQKQVEEMCKHDCTPEKLPYPQGDDWRKPLVPLLQDWFKALKFADAGHRAAGLLAADSLLKAFESVMPRDHFGSSQSSTAEQSKLCSQLKALGADISLDITGSYYYSGSWLTKAKDLNLDSEGGRLASLFWMSTAGDGNLAEPGSELFREVIKKGKALLTKKIDAVTAAQVHFMIGDAYSDIVALAAGEIGGNGDYDASKYEAEAEEDQTKALAHYRAGLAIDNASPSAKDAWSQAWHLSSGLLPRQRYVCFGD